jgi:hypothetical protein
VHAAVLKINQLLERKAEVPELMEAMKIPAAGIKKIEEPSAAEYRQRLIEARETKAAAAGPTVEVGFGTERKLDCLVHLFISLRSTYFDSSLSLSLSLSFSSTYLCSLSLPLLLLLLPLPLFALTHEFRFFIFFFLFYRAKSGMCMTLT